MPPGGKFKSILGDFFPIMASTFMKLICHGPILIRNDLVEIQQNLNGRTSDIHDFVDTVTFNEIEIKQNLQSDSMNLKSTCYLHLFLSLG